MPRPLVFGNGTLLIAFDNDHSARDLFWPNVGYPNHLLGHAMRVGIYCDGDFSWCDSSDWDKELGYEAGTLVGRSLWRSWKAGLEITITEAVHPNDPVFVRKFKVTDLRGSARAIKIFFTQNLILGQSDVGNTAFFDPFAHTVVHYRGHHVVVLGGEVAGNGLTQYATGITGFDGLEGTWRDAEDGELSMNPIAQGSVDSTFSLEMNLQPQGEEVASFALCFGDRHDEATEVYQKYKAVGWDNVIMEARAESTKWLAPTSDKDWPLLQRSLLIIRSQIDSGGAILAANDSDILKTNRATYSYCWPRDGALTSMTLSRYGYTEYCDRFLDFCTRVRPHNGQFLMQKYRSDEALGASWHPWIVDGRGEVPFQEDETALAILAIESCSAEKRPEVLKEFGLPSAEFLLNHRDKNGLPLPSWDLWEERHGVHFFTVCSVIAALSCMSRLVADDQRYAAAAREMRVAMESHFWIESENRYARMIRFDGETVAVDRTADSAVFGGLLLLPEPDLGRVGSTVDFLQSRLQLAGGGVARYESDYYFRRTEKVTGNPWIISTMWLARILLLLGRKGEARQCITWCEERAAASGVLAEQYHPETNEPLSVSPLTWSHAEYLETAFAWRKHE